MFSARAHVMCALGTHVAINISYSISKVKRILPAFSLIEAGNVLKNFHAMIEARYQ